MNNLIARYRTQLSKETGFDYRWVLMAVVTLNILILMAIGSYFYGDHYYVVYLPEEPGTPSFEDLRLITSGFDCVRNGVDVLYASPCDHDGRAFNYPRIILSLANTGIGEQHTEVIGILIGLIFIASAIIFAGRLNVPQFLIYASIMCSPAVIFALHQGNSDLVVFILLACFLIVSPRSRRHEVASLSLISLATVIKLFPAFSALYYLNRKQKHFSTIIAIFAFLVFSYFLFFWDDMARVISLVPKGHLASFGSFMFPDGFAMGMRYAGINIDIFWSHVLSTGLAVSIIIRLIFVTSRERSTIADMTFIDGFRIGGGIYVGAFLFGNNYDYRLIFLIFTVPQLIAWSKNSYPLGMRATIPLILVVTRLWGTIRVDAVQLLYLSEIIQQTIEWLLFAYYVRMLLMTLPEWMKSYMYKPVTFYPAS